MKWIGYSGCMNGEMKCKPTSRGRYEGRAAANRTALPSVGLRAGAECRYKGLAAVGDVGGRTRKKCAILRNEPEFAGRVFLYIKHGSNGLQIYATFFNSGSFSRDGADLKELTMPGGGGIQCWTGIRCTS